MVAGVRLAGLWYAVVNILLKQGGAKLTGHRLNPNDTAETCTSDQFLCNTGFCISLALRCDSVPDCYDKSDESSQECGYTDLPPPTVCTGAQAPRSFPGLSLFLSTREEALVEAEVNLHPPPQEKLWNLDFVFSDSQTNKIVARVDVYHDPKKREGNDFVRVICGNDSETQPGLPLTITLQVESGWVRLYEGSGQQRKALLQLNCSSVIWPQSRHLQLDVECGTGTVCASISQDCQRASSEVTTTPDSTTTPSDSPPVTDSSFSHPFMLALYVSVVSMVIVMAGCTGIIFYSRCKAKPHLGHFERSVQWSSNCTQSSYFPTSQHSPACLTEEDRQGSDDHLYDEPLKYFQYNVQPASKSTTVDLGNSDQTTANSLHSANQPDITS